MFTKTRLTLDGVAFGTAFAHALGWWKDNVGTVAATISVVYLLLQCYFFVKDRVVKNVH